MFVSAVCLVSNYSLFNTDINNEPGGFDIQSKQFDGQGTPLPISINKFKFVVTSRIAVCR